VAQHLDLRPVILYINARCQENHAGGNLRTLGLPLVRG
jgi:hypothetical protein